MTAAENSHQIPFPLSKKRKGSVLVIVAGALMMILGFGALAVDYGTSVVIKNRLQRVSDAAALAGGSQLRQTGVDATDYYNARVKAIDNAFRNGITISAADVTFPTRAQCVVTITTQRRFLFGSAIGVPTGRVNARAMAGRYAVRGLSGAVPLGITRQTFNRFRPTDTNPVPRPVSLGQVRNTQERFGPLNSESATITDSTMFNMVALDLRFGTSGNSGALFQEEVAAGSASRTNINQLIDPLGSSLNSQGEKLIRGINTRLQNAISWGDPYSTTTPSKYDFTQSTFPKIDMNNPRVIWILVGDDGYNANNSNPQLNLQYFAPAYVMGPAREVREPDGSMRTYLDVRLMPTGELNQNTPNIIVSDNPDEDTGMAVLRLLG
jgi:Flp pilus assembly protein TadG